MPEQAIENKSDVLYYAYVKYTGGGGAFFGKGESWTVHFERMKFSWGFATEQAARKKAVAKFDLNKPYSVECGVIAVRIEVLEPKPVFFKLTSEK
jgi:hypothetical protein